MGRKQNRSFLNQTVIRLFFVAVLVVVGIWPLDGRKAVAEQNILQTGEEDTGPQYSGMQQDGPGAALGFGNQYLNELGEKILSEHGRVRSGLGFDEKGKLQGEVDFLYPLSSGDNHLFFMQAGTRSMSDDRWIANMGLGQRFFPTEDVAVGVNAFVDYDLTREHTRGSVGGELWLDWLRMYGNYYMPLSGWKTSKDLEVSLERPAKGWDVGTTAYLPFYRNLAVKSSYSQWYGEKVGVFSASSLKEDPSVWGYEVEYTPVPLVSAYFNKKKIESGGSDSEFGLRFNYNFSMPFEDALDHSKVAEMRTVSGSRDEFVSRENRMILEYKEKAFNVFLSASSYRGQGGSILNVPVIVSSAAPITSIVWEGTAASYLVGGDENGGRFLLPPYVPGGNNVYSARVTMRNEARQYAFSQFASIEVLPFAGYVLALQADNSNPVLGQNVTITAILSQAQASSLLGKKLSWSISPSGAGTFTPTSITNVNGRASALFNTAGVTPGDFDVTVRLVDEPTVSASLRVRVGAAPSSYVLNLSSAPSAPVQGDVVSITAELLNNGVPAANVPLNLELVSGDGSLITANVTTGPDGRGVLTFRAGAHDALLRVAAGSSGELASQTINVPVSSSYGLAFSFDPPAPLAGEMVHVKVTLTNFGLPMNDVPIRLDIESGGGSVMSPLRRSNSGGEADFIYIAGTQDVVFRATAGASPGFYTDTSSLALSHNYNLQVSYAPMRVGAGGTATITAVVTDNNIPVNNVPVQLFRLSGPGTVTHGTAVTGATGTAVLEFAAGDADAVLQVSAGAPVSLSRQINLELDASYSLLLDANPTEILAGETAALEATLLKNGAAMSGVPLHLEIISGGGGITPSSANTNSSGKAAFTYTAKCSSTILRALSDNPPLQSNSVLVSVISNFSLVLTPSPANPTPGQTVTIEATLTNNGIPMVGVPLELKILSGDGTPLVAMGTTGSDGKINLSYIAGMSDAVIEVNAGSPKFYSETVTVNVTPDYRLVFSTDNPNPKTGDIFPVTVEFKNGSLPVAGANINWSVSPSGAAGISGGGLTNSSGKATILYEAKQSGPATITAQAPAHSVSDSMLVNVSPLYSLKIDADVNIINNGGTSSLTATLMDGSNPVEGANISWSIPAGTGEGVLASANSVTGAGTGQAANSFEGTRGGNVTVRATHGGSGVFADLHITIRSDYVLTLTPASVTINNKESVVLGALLKDGTKLVSGAKLNWSITSSDGAVGGLTDTATFTNGSGESSSTFTAKRGGTMSVRATLEGYPSVTSECVVTINPAYSIVLTSNPAVVDNDEPSQLWAIVMDGDLPLSGRTVNWSIVSGGTGSFSVASGVTAVDGKTSTSFTPSSSGTIRLRAELDGTGVVQEVNLLVSSVYRITLSASSENIRNGDEITLTALLKDGPGFGAGQQIDWGIASGGTGAGVLGAASGITGAGGQAQTTFRASKSGTVILHASLHADPSIYAEISVIIDPAYTLEFTPVTSEVRTEQVVTLSVTLKDGVQPVSGAKISWSALSGANAGNLSTAASYTNASGVASCLFTPQVSGAVQFRAALDSDANVFDELGFTVLPLYTLTLEPYAQQVKNGGKVGFSVTLLDGQTPVDGQAISWSVGSGSVGNGTFGGYSGVTAGGGEASVEFTATRSGQVSIRAELSGDGTVYDEKLITITPVYSLVPSADVSALPNQSSTAVSVQLLDGGLPVSGKTISWSVVHAPAGGNGSLSVLSSVTSGSGNAGVTFTASKGGLVAVHAVMDEKNDVQANINIQITPQYNIAFSALSHDIQNKTHVGLMVELTDGETPLPAESVRWSIAGTSTGAGFLNPDVAQTNAAGETSSLFTATKGGNVTLRATMVREPSVYKEITIVVRPVYSISIVVNPANPDNGENVEVQAILKDGDTPLPGKEIIWTVEQGAGVFTPASSVTDADGVAHTVFQPTGSGSMIVRASIAENPSKYQDLTFNVGSVFKLGVSASSLALSTGGNTTLTALLKDGNLLAAGYSLNWSILSGGSGAGTLSSNSGVTGPDGTATVVFQATKRGNISIRVSLASDSSIYADINLVVNPSYNLIFNPVPSSVKTGDSVPLSVVLWDGSNLVSGQDILWEISGLPASTLGASASATGSGGAATNIFVPSSQSALVTIKATLSSNSSVTAQVNLVVTPKYTFSVTPASLTVNTGDSFTLTATLMDGATPSANKQILWSRADVPGQDLGSVTTNSSGQAIRVFTATLAGPVVLRATLAEDSSVYADVSVNIVPNYTLTIEPPPILKLSLLAPITINAKLTDSGLPVPNAVIDWQIVPVGVALAGVTPAATLTNASGNTSTQVQGIALGYIWVVGTMRGYPDVTASVRLLVVLVL